MERKSKWLLLYLVDKKFLFIFVAVYFALCSYVGAATIEGGVDFDWITKTQIERDENINQIRNIIFSESTVKKFNKKEFKSKYEEYLLDDEHFENYTDVKRGVVEKQDIYLAGFYVKKLLYMYAIQHKDNMKTIFYYDSMGHLRYVDILSENYPNYPYYSKQYKINGKLISTIYFI